MNADPKESIKEFEALCEKYRKSIYLAALAIVRDPDDAEDVVAETLVRAFKNMPQIHPSAFRSWCLRTAERLAIDWYRKKRRTNFGQKPLDPSDMDAEPIDSDAPGTVGEVLGGDLGRALIDCFKHRAALEKRILADRYYEDLSIQEIANRYPIFGGRRRSAERLLEKTEKGLANCLATKGYREFESNLPAFLAFWSSE